MSPRVFGPGLALSVILVICAGLGIALTYAPCYATVCSESYFGLQTRAHIGIFYGILITIGGALVLHAHSLRVARASSTVLVHRRLVGVGRYATVGGALLAFWIVAATAATTGLWHAAEDQFWRLRTDPLDWETAKAQLTATGILGHFADILIGLLVLPVSRNSLLGKLCGIHQSSLLLGHKLIAYLLAIAVAAHGAAYIAFLATYDAAERGSLKREAFSLENPFFTIEGLKERGRWYKATLPTGVIGLTLILVLVVTALPIVRRRNYNTFYYAHMICAVLTFVVTCLHASTNFYFLLPGLLLWINDWAWRIFKGDAGLSKKVSGTLTNVGGGWYRIVLSSSVVEDECKGPHLSEKQIPNGPPLQTYFLNFPAISRLQNHPFTAVSVRTRGAGPTFLFQKSAMTGRRSEKRLQKEWTWRLAAFVDETCKVGCAKQIDCRIEGPYNPPTTGYETAAQIICVVGGTGLTGAYGLALWWRENRAGDPNASFVLFWTVRDRESAACHEWNELTDQIKDINNMDIAVNISSEAGRMDIGGLIKGTLAKHTQLLSKSIWVYSSGPTALLNDVEDICLSLRSGRNGTCGRLNLSHYSSDYER